MKAIDPILESINIVNLTMVFSALAVGIAFLSLVLTLRDKRRQKHEALISALQGEKEAVAFIAFQLRHHRWGHRKSERLELLSALVVAWIFEKSDRARAMIHNALKVVQNIHSKDVELTIKNIREQLEVYVECHYPEETKEDGPVGKYLVKLDRLCKALKCKGKAKVT